MSFKISNIENDNTIEEMLYIINFKSNTGSTGYVQGPTGSQGPTGCFQFCITNNIRY